MPSIARLVKHFTGAFTMSDHPLVALAACAIAAYLRDRQFIEPPEDLLSVVPEASRPGASFVCLKSGDRLRGCIGTIYPKHGTLALEVIHNAVAAATRDPRFDALELADLVCLAITVDALGACERISSPEYLDPERFGIVVRCGQRQGVLLPDLEHIRTSDEQVAVACEKAGIRLDEPRELFRFTVTRYR
jgi:AmmeMemoRadiSam system protein A